MWLSQFAKQVTIVVRSSDVSMSQYLINQIRAAPNIKVQTRCEIVKVAGDGRLERVVVRSLDSGEEAIYPAAAMFIFIGAVAHTEMVAGLVERNAQGFILTGPDLQENGKWPKGWTLKRDPFLLETSVPGIFAAGDIRAMAVRRVASAVGQGAMAISQVHQYLKTV